MGLIARYGLISFLVAAAVSAGAQEEVSPEVQRLYAAAQAAQAAGKPAVAIEEYQHIVRLAPGLAAAYNNLGRLLYNAGRFSEAAPVLRKGLELNPAMPPARVMLGASYFQMGEPKEARPELEAGVAAMPEDRFARMTLVRTLLALGETEAATGQLEALLRTDAKDQEAWYLLGKLHLQLSQAAFAKVQAIDPNAPLAHELEGEIMESLSNTPGAVAAYKQAIAAAPNDPVARMHLADVYWKTGDWASARRAYGEVLAVEPGNCTAEWRLANSLIELGEAGDEALGRLNRAIGACPALVQAHAERARVLLRQGKPADAVADLQVAEAGAPDEPSVQRLLAQAYRAMGETAKAEAANRRFQELQQAMHQAEERHAAAVIQANQ